MEIISGGRRCGKTHQAIHLAAKHDGQIVCASERDAKNTAAMAKHMGLKIRKPITIYKLTNMESCGTDTKGYIFDDVERILHFICNDGVPILGLTMLKDDKETGDEG